MTTDREESGSSVLHYFVDEAGDPTYRYRPTELYDTLVGELFRKLHRLADRAYICFAKRGTRSRSQALRTALADASRKFEQSFGFRNPTATHVTSTTPPSSDGLQAVDYFLWALQRFYEREEDRYLELVWPLVSEVHDLDFVSEGRRGVFYRQGKPLTLETRPAQKEEPGI